MKHLDILSILSALFSCLKNRALRFPPTIGLMLIAILLSHTSGHLFLAAVTIPVVLAARLVTAGSPVSLVRLFCLSCGKESAGSSQEQSAPIVVWGPTPRLTPSYPEPGSVVDLKLTGRFLYLNEA